MMITKGDLVTLSATTDNKSISVSGVVCDIDDIGFSLSSSERRVSVDWDSVYSGRVSIECASESGQAFKLAA